MRWRDETAGDGWGWGGMWDLGLGVEGGGGGVVKGGAGVWWVGRGALEFGFPWRRGLMRGGEGGMWVWCSSGRGSRATQ